MCTLCNFAMERNISCAHCVILPWTRRDPSNGGIEDPIIEIEKMFVSLAYLLKYY
jgi:hypothetical protein